MATVKVLDRLKLELNNKDYFEDNEYIIYLNENNLNENDSYNKETMQKNLLLTVVAVLEAVSNDIDKMRKIQTEFETTDGAYTYLSKRIQDLKEKINIIPDTSDNETNNVSKLFGSRW